MREAVQLLGTGYDDGGFTLFTLLHAGSAAPPTNNYMYARAYLFRAYYPVPSAAAESLRDP